MSTDDPICICGHHRSEHAEEQPYECQVWDLDETGEFRDSCYCDQFEFAPIEAK